MKAQNVICSFLGMVRSDEMKMKMKIRVFIFIFIDGKERPQSEKARERKLSAESFALPGTGTYVIDVGFVQLLSYRYRIVSII